MKIIKTASDKQKLKLSKSEWQSIGKTAGWIKEAKKKSVIFYETDGNRVSHIAQDEGTAASLFRTHKWNFDINGKRYDKNDMDGRKAIDVLFNGVSAKKEKVYMSNVKRTKTAGEDWLVNADFTNQVILELTNMGDDILSSNDHSITINHKIGNKIVKGLIIKVFEGSYGHDFILQAFNGSKMLVMSDGSNAKEAIGNMDGILGTIIASIPAAK